MPSIANTIFATSVTALVIGVTACNRSDSQNYEVPKEVITQLNSDYAGQNRIKILEDDPNSVEITSVIGEQDFNGAFNIRAPFFALHKATSHFQFFVDLDVVPNPNNDEWISGGIRLAYNNKVIRFERASSWSVDSIIVEVMNRDTGYRIKGQLENLDNLGYDTGVLTYIVQYLNDELSLFVKDSSGQLCYVSSFDLSNERPRNIEVGLNLIVPDPNPNLSMVFKSINFKEKDFDILSLGMADNRNFPSIKLTEEDLDQVDYESNYGAMDRAFAAMEAASSNDPFDLSVKLGDQGSKAPLDTQSYIGNYYLLTSSSESDQGFYVASSEEALFFKAYNRPEKFTIQFDGNHILFKKSQSQFPDPNSIFYIEINEETKKFFKLFPLSPSSPEEEVIAITSGNIIQSDQGALATKLDLLPSQMAIINPSTYYNTDDLKASDLAGKTFYLEPSEDFPGALLNFLTENQMNCKIMGSPDLPDMPYQLEGISISIIFNGIDLSFAIDLNNKKYAVFKGSTLMSEGNLNTSADPEAIQLQDQKIKTKTETIQCFNNLKMLSLGLRLFAADHNDQHVHETEKFSSSRKLNEEGFDENSIAYFNELISSGYVSSSMEFVCPSDSEKQGKSLGTTTLTQDNITYLYRSGDKVNDSNPSQVILYCPIHHNMSLIDGTSLAPGFNMPQEKLDAFLKSKTVHSWEFSF